MRNEGKDAEGRRGCGRKERMQKGRRGCGRKERMWKKGEDAEGKTGTVDQRELWRNIVRRGQFLNHQKATGQTQRTRTKIKLFPN